MKEKSLDLSGKTEPFAVELFRIIAEIAESIGTPFFVVGATARDMIFEYGYGIEPARATRDIDLAVQVPGWDHYAKLRDELIQTGKFESAREAQRLKYMKTVAIDMIPFGAIAGPGGSFSWPPDHDVEMNTIGFEESYQHSLTVRVGRNPDLLIRFASPAGLALMKLVSWSEGRPERNKDAKDLGFLMRKHIEAGNEDRLFEEESDLIGILADRGEFDYLKASARLLGRDISAMARPKTRERLLYILERETGEKDRYRLVEEMMDAYVPSLSDFEENLALLEELMAGLQEGPRMGLKD